MPRFSKEYSGTLIYAKLIIVFTPNLEFSPYPEAIHGSTTFKLRKGWWKMINNSVWCFWSFVFFSTMSQTINVINISGGEGAIFYMHQNCDACAGVCACNRTHKMEKTGLNKSYSHSSQKVFIPPPPFK